MASAAFLAKGRKEDLRLLAIELGEEVDDSMRHIELRDIIIKSRNYDEAFVKEQLATIIEERKENTDIEKLRLQMQINSVERCQTPHAAPDTSKFEMKHLIPKFKTDEDISLYLILFERQLKMLKVPENLYVNYLISNLPTDIAMLIAREDEDKASDYAYVKSLLLQRFKLNAEKFRQLFSQHRKDPNKTWRDFYFELKSYFEGWLSNLNINSFEMLQELLIADQMKKRCPPEVRDHYLDEWSNFNSPMDLAERLDLYENTRSHLHKKETNRNDLIKKENKPKFPPEAARKPHTFKRENERTRPQFQTGQRPTTHCYGCGRPGFTKPRCPTCSPPEKREEGSHSEQMYTCHTKAQHIALIDLTICGVKAKICADTGASRSVAGERLYNLLISKGIKFGRESVTMTLADGQQSTIKVYTATVPIEIHGRFINTNFMVMPHATENRSLLGQDFLADAGIVLDLKNRRWNFWDDPLHHFNFRKEVEDEPLRPTVVEINSCILREEEGKQLKDDQRKRLNTLLRNYEKLFQPGGEATPFVEHRINTGDKTPVAAPPYRMSPAKKELLKKEIDELLEKGIIEECESPYAAPVVLIPKPNGTIRLCVDYRKLNANTVPDTYPLPRMDDLLHDAKHSAYISTIDLKSGYHQVEVYPPHRDKTAFVCPFGTFRFNRMPFGLRNAPATFQRLMDNFRRGLSNINLLTYLDDIIVLSPTFENHLLDLKAVFDRLILYKLTANREKCNFSCDQVKYLGHWITPKGVQVDHDKVSAIAKIPPPKTVKQLQSFLQTCSWYRRFIKNFADISQPLSNLTRKKVPWSWSDREQKAYETLKQCLISTPILKQVDEQMPFIVRTDASNYALGAILLQGEGADEHPIEYASRLLNSAERNYSTTEREALAIVWALNKFRGYVEGAEVTVASDHQPLKWLMSLKSPSGRLARWALQLQSFNLKLTYLPGKSNVIADMLSRPPCQHKESSCEICTVTIGLPSKNPKEIRENQLKDPDLQKIVDCFEQVDKREELVNWTDRGYIMNQGVLYRYAPESDAEDAQLVVPLHERNRVLQEHHDDATAGHYGAEGTFQRISKRYFWTGMRKFIADYVKNCCDCNRYKASNLKPAGLLQTPVHSQRFETLAIDLFGPLPESKDGQKWIFIIEDCATRWVELFALQHATARECATTLLEEVILRYGLPRRIISDNGTQFVSAVMQQLCFLLKIKQSFVPVYHPQANPVERKNRDLKPRLAILVGNEHTLWPEKLAPIRFAMNTAKCESTGQTAAFLQFGRELRTTDDVTHDIRTVIKNDNFVPEITPFLKRFVYAITQVREVVEKKQDQRKKYADKNRRPGAQYAPGDTVWVSSHPISKAKQGKTAKFMPRRDGPYIILTQRSPTTYEVANPASPEVPLGVYHTSALRPCQNANAVPVMPLRKRGRPRKVGPGSVTGRQPGTRGGVCDKTN